MYNTVQDTPKSGPKSRSIWSAVLTEHRLVTDGRTDKHRVTADTALAQRRAVENRSAFGKFKGKSI